MGPFLLFSYKQSKSKVGLDASAQHGFAFCPMVRPFRLTDSQPRWTSG
jgi:hypothetical protein